MSAMSTMLDAALGYVALGWAVLPLKPNSKRPLGRLVPHGLLDASAEPETVAAWWGAEPSANIGLVTGAVFDVLDLDPGHGGAETLGALVERFGPLPATPEVATGGGGTHFLFAHDPRVRCSAGRLGDGLDVRGSGGFVVAAPSVHPNGRRYAWTVRDLPPPDWSTWLLALILPVQSASRPAPLRVCEAGCTPFGRAVLRRACEAVEAARTGRRHDVLRGRARVVGGFVAGGEIALDLAHDCLMAAALATGLPAEEVTRTVAWGLTQGAASPLCAQGRAVR